VPGQHDLQQLRIEPARVGGDRLGVEQRLKVEVVGQGAGLEVEVDQAGCGEVAGALTEQEGRLDGRRRGADAARGGNQSDAQASTISSVRASVRSQSTTRSRSRPRTVVSSRESDSVTMAPLNPVARKLSMAAIEASRLS
jgi:hypothetical protein